MLADFGDEMDQTSSRMDSVLKKLEKVSHMTSSKFTHRSILFAVSGNYINVKLRVITDTSQVYRLICVTQGKKQADSSVLRVRSETVVCHRCTRHHLDRRPHPLLCPLMSVNSQARSSTPPSCQGGGMQME